MTGAIQGVYQKNKIPEPVALVKADHHASKYNHLMKFCNFYYDAQKTRCTRNECK